ncbi:helix-turn-helix transcriptional regulator [Planococcus salinus]|uniref:XRE family transcriptional regulator n=1 Tax=Planococcus salinus TaxID=1848460 RepID=A0A3M8P529_9BACL|nr:helix-turn-helix transcriptional regulator [Planococcus salinus]RNF38776.1 XRE family transcriptional regulator [Planococcus salinus]
MDFVERYAKQRAATDKNFEKVWNDPEEQMNFQLRKELITLRLQLGLTQQQFADLVGVAQPLISRLENGSQNITVEKLQRILAKTQTGARLKIEIEQDDLMANK